MTFEKWFGKDLTGTTYDGDLICSHNKLTSLKGCPKIVNGNFSCFNNNLTSLEHCPQTINGNFSCSGNKLTSLKGCPETVNGDFYCHHNNLTSLEHCPYVNHLYSNFSDKEVKEYYKEHYPEMMI